MISISEYMKPLPNSICNELGLLSPLKCDSKKLKLPRVGSLPLTPSQSSLSSYYLYSE